MEVTLALSRGDLADLQEILAENIVRINKKRNSGRVSPGQIFLLYEQQKLLVGVKQQLHAAASTEHWRDMHSLKNARIVRSDEEARQVSAAAIDDTKMHVRFLPSLEVYNEQDVRALLCRPKPSRRKETEQ